MGGREPDSGPEECVTDSTILPVMVPRLDVCSSASHILTELPAHVAHEMAALVALPNLPGL